MAEQEVKPANDYYDWTDYNAENLTRRVKVSKPPFTTQDLANTYKSGKPLYPRHLIEDMVRQMRERRKVVEITNFDGSVDEYRYDDGYGPDIICFITYQGLIMNSVGYKQQSMHVLADELSKPFPMAKNPNAPHHIHLFAHQRQEWLKSVEYKFMSKQLDDIKKLPLIKKIVCIALGSMDGGLNPDKSQTQHARADSLREYLQTRQGLGKIACFAQDPAYLPLDKEILENLDMEEVDARTAEGLRKVDKETLVVSAYPCVAVRQFVADDANYWPAMLIVNSIAPSAEAQAANEFSPHSVLWGECFRKCETGGYAVHMDATSQRVRDMVKDCVAWHFPGYGRKEFNGQPLTAKGVHGLSMYVRKVGE